MAGDGDRHQDEPSRRQHVQAEPVGWNEQQDLRLSTALQLKHEVDRRLLRLKLYLFLSDLWNGTLTVLLRVKVVSRRAIVAFFFLCILISIVAN